MLAAFRHREFRLLWFGWTLSSVGVSIHQLAIGLLIIEMAERDGSPHLVALYVGLLGFTRAGPGVVFGLLGGVIADRFNRRHLLFATGSVALVTAVTLAGLAVAGQVTIGVILVLSAISTVSTSVDLPARFSLIPHLVPQRDLASALGLTNVTFNLAWLIGPLLGGLLLGPLGVSGLLVVTAGATLALLGALVLMRPVPTATPERRMGTLESLREGFAFVLHEPVLVWVVSLSALLGIFARPLPQLLPAVAHDTLRVGAVELAWLLGTAGLGSFIGALVSTRLGLLPRRGLILSVSLVALGVTLVLFALQTSLVPALATLVLPGLCLFVFSGMSQNLMQTRTPDHLRGRAVSIYLTSVTGVLQLGVGLLGAAGSVVGVNTAIAVGGIVLGLTGVYLVIRVAALRDVGTSADALLQPVPPR